MAGESLNTQQRMDVALDALMDDESQQKKEQAEKEKQRQQEKEKQKQRELRKQQQQQNKQNKQKNQRSSNKTKNRSGHKSKNGGRKTSGHGNARRGQRTSKNSGKLKKKGSDINLSLSPLPAPTMKKDESVTNSNWGLNDQSVTSVNASGRRIRQYRMTLVGYSKVGKTALCTQFVENKFKNDYPRHKELLFKKKIDLPEMPTYRFMVDILDTQGAQEVKNREIVMEDRYRKRTNHIMIFVFSITNDKSFKFIEELLRIEYEADSEYFEKQGVIIIGNKCDQVEDREVETPDARELARDYGAAYFETSAKTNTNVDKAFYESIRKYHEKSGELEETMEPAKKLCPGCTIL